LELEALRWWLGGWGEWGGYYIENLQLEERRKIEDRNKKLNPLIDIETQLLQGIFYTVQSV